MVNQSWAGYTWDWDEGWRWGVDDPPPPMDAAPDVVAAWEERLSAAKSEYEAALAARLPDRPRELPRADVRPYFRAVAMLAAGNAADLGRTERLKVSRHLLDFTDGPRQVGHAAVESGLVGLAARFVDPENYDPDGDGVMTPPVQVPRQGLSADFDWSRHREIVDDAVRDALAEQNEQLDKVFDDIWNAMHQGFRGVADITIGMHDPKHLKQVMKDQRRGRR